MPYLIYASVVLDGSRLVAVHFISPRSRRVPFCAYNPLHASPSALSTSPSSSPSSASPYSTPHAAHLPDDQYVVDIKPLGGKGRTRSHQFVVPRSVNECERQGRLVTRVTPAVRWSTAQGLAMLVTAIRIPALWRHRGEGESRKVLSELDSRA
jgi:hypothetical protein